MNNWNAYKPPKGTPSFSCMSWDYSKQDAQGWIVHTCHTSDGVYLLREPYIPSGDLTFFPDAPNERNPVTVKDEVTPRGLICETLEAMQAEKPEQPLLPAPYKSEQLDHAKSFVDWDRLIDLLRECRNTPEVGLQSIPRVTKEREREGWSGPIQRGEKLKRETPTVCMGAYWEY